MRLIDADALLDSGYPTIYHTEYGDEVINVEDIKNAPTVEERPTGKWTDTGDMQEYWAEEYQCSICGEKDHWHNFCPNCGAKMEGGEEE